MWCVWPSILHARGQIGSSYSCVLRLQGRVCVLCAWFAFLSVVTLHALWSYATARAPVKAGEKRLLSASSAGGVRVVVQQRSASVMDGRLLVRLLQPLGSACACCLCREACKHQPHRTGRHARELVPYEQHLLRAQGTCTSEFSKLTMSLSLRAGCRALVRCL